MAPRSTKRESVRTVQLHSFDPIAAPERAARVWKALEGEGAPTFFQSWAWMGTWLRLLPPHASVRLWVVRDGDREVAAFFVGARRIVRHRVLPSRALFLNTAGLPEDDACFLEHNAPLVREGVRLDWDELLPELGARWDEMFFAAADPAQVPAVGDRGAYAVTEQRRLPSPYVDLDRVRASSGGYPALVSKGVRTQIVRSKRLYEERGPITLEVARDASEALAVFEELVELHGATWRERGEEGAFASDHMLRFHRELIRGAAASGAAQLVRVRVAGETLGCLYNLVSRGHVAFYQSGLRREEDNRLKPGMTCHAEAVAENARRGHRVYDFLAGTSRYKTDLATDASQVVWMRAARKRRRFWLEDRAREVRDAFVELRQEFDRRRAAAATEGAPIADAASSAASAKGAKGAKGAETPGK
jgi:CelD/BcsL family acetyltransferase involved in cellulose biosynthesis